MFNAIKPEAWNNCQKNSIFLKMESLLSVMTTKKIQFIHNLLNMMHLAYWFKLVLNCEL